MIHISVYRYWILETMADEHRFIMWYKIQLVNEPQLFASTKKTGIFCRVYYPSFALIHYFLAWFFSIYFLHATRLFVF